jgi:hypothetical protein
LKLNPELKKQVMNACSTQNANLERLFARSCLESAPRPVHVRLMVHFPSAPPGGSAHSQFHRLKQKILHAALEETCDAELSKRLCGAANEAAALAWDTECPALVFPCLFEELVQEIREQFQPTTNLEAGFVIGTPDAPMKSFPVQMEG